MALIKKLENIGNAIREKTGKTDLLTLEQMVTEIEAIETGGGSAELPEEAYLITGDCGYRFYKGGWDWFLREYGDKITTENITEANYMFEGSKTEEIPFDFNFNNSTYRDTRNMFNGCNKVTKIGKIINAYPSNMLYFFGSCNMLRELPEFENFNPSRIQTYAYANISQMFSGCFSLRRIPEDFLKQLWGIQTSSSVVLSYAFNNCYVLDEVKGLNPKTGTITSNFLGNTFYGCYRVKDIIFDTQEDGTPYPVNWKSQTLNLMVDGYSSQTVGVAALHENITRYNSGITTDKRVTDDATYQALKDDPDWWTTDIAYSRYNHDSAVNTINSLPDTSAYLATAGGTNTIKFRGAAGSATDGGAINTLTEEEIAVATAKGWTITLV